MNSMIKLYKKLFLPNEYAPSIYDINYDAKKEEVGIKYAIFDLDGTLVPFDSLEVDDRLQEFIEQLKSKNMGIGIYSDGREQRVKPVADALQIPYIHRARKPFGSFKTIHQMFGHNCNPYNTMLIGNMSYFDTLFANRIGMHNVLVDTLRDRLNAKELICDASQLIFTKPIKEEFQEYGRKK